MQRAEILIIDNLMESVALLLRYFQNEPIDAMVALNGVDGLRKAREGQPDVILLDVAMPGMDGYAVCRALKADPRTAAIPVIFLSANTRLQHKLDGFAAGGVDYIGKPFSSEEVMTRVCVHLRACNVGRIGPAGVELQHRAIREADGENKLVTTALALLLGGMLLPAVRRKGLRALGIVLCAVAMLGGAAGLSGCGGDSNVKVAPKGTYTVVLTATPSVAGASVQTATITIAVQ